MLSVIFAAILTFVATEIDDFAIYVILYAQKKEHKVSIFAGQLTAIILISVLCAFVSIPLSRIPSQYLRFIGLVPIVLGFLSIFEKEENYKSFKNSSMFLTSLFLTIAASGDNIGVYIPFLSSITLIQKFVVIGIFIVLQIGLSILQIKTANIQVVQAFVEKTSKFIVPVVFILLGILIICNLL